MAWDGGGLDSHFFSKHNRWVDLAHLTNSPHEWSDRGQVFASPQWPRQSGEGGDWSGCFICRYPPPPPPPAISICSLLTMHGLKRVLYMPLTPSPPPPLLPPHPISICCLLTNNGLKRVLYMTLPPPPPPPPLPLQPPFQSALFWQCTNSHEGAIYIWTNFITW